MQKINKYPPGLLLLFFAMPAFCQQSFFIDNTVAKSISAATYDNAKKAVMFFASNTVFYYPLNSEKTITPDWYTLSGVAKVDAAVDWDDDNALFFDGSTYRMFQQSSGQFVSETTQWPGLPAAWNNNLDGAVKWDNDLIVFFYNDEYMMYSISGKNIVGQDKITNWNGWPGSWADGIDDAFTIGDGFIYFLRAGELMTYSTKEKIFNAPQKILAYNAAPANGLPPATVSNTMPGIKTNIAPQSNDISSSNGTAAEKIAQPIAAADMSGCVTGAPASSGLREKQSPLAGQQGANLYDNLPKGYHISSIKIFTSKVWGKSVISGIQTILKSATGQQAEQPVLGRKTVTENVLMLDDDECITGISGTRNGESGDFIYSLQITTSKKSSPVFGERTSEPSRQPFNIRMPSDAIFNGFAGNFNNNFTGIGIKYFGEESSANSNESTASYTSNNSEASVQTSSSVETQYGRIKLSSEHGESNVPENKGTPGKDGYIDNYADHTSTMGNDYEFSLKTMPGIEWLGAGFDILKFDPLKLNDASSKKSFRAILLTNSPERSGNKGQYVKPYGTQFNSISAGSNIDSNAWVSSYQSFANSFNISVEGSVKVPQLAAGSQSGSFKEMNNSSLGSESIFYFLKISRKIHDLELMQTWRGTNGEKYRQKLDGYFREDVAALPVIKGIPAISTDEMKKGVPLPGGLEQIKTKYLAFIAKYGTHYTSRVAWGGQYVVRSELKRSDYEHAHSSEQQFKNTAEVTIKKVTVGRSVEWGSSEGNQNSTGKGIERTAIFVQGGNGQTNVEKWEDKVDDAPSPVEMIFTSYADLLNKEMFSTDPDIEAKSRLLAIFTEKYMVDNMQPPTASRDDFFRPLPDLPMPGDLSVTNSAGLVLRIKVKYQLNGEWKNETSSSFSVGMSRNFQIPVDATNIKLTCEYFTGWLDNTKIAFEESFAKPELKCFKVTGTLFSQDHQPCEK